MHQQSDHCRVDQEIKDLKQEIDEFKKEKERVRSIVGRIGGVPTFNTKIFNIIFAVLVGACLVISIFLARTSPQIILGEIALAAVSIKLMYLLHSQMRVNHFQLWVLSSIEWRINELTKSLPDVSAQDSQEST